MKKVASSYNNALKTFGRSISTLELIQALLSSLHLAFVLIKDQHSKSPTETNNVPNPLFC